MEILSLGGQPTPQQWEHYDTWWLANKASMAQDDDQNSPDWVNFLMWKSKAFMSEYWSLSNKLSKNPFVLTVEEIAWSTGHLSQVSKFVSERTKKILLYRIYNNFKIQLLLDMKLVQAEDLKLKSSNANYLQNMAKLPIKIIETEGKWARIQKLLKNFFPVTGKGWLYGNVRRQDWSVLQSEVLDGPVPLQNVAVPVFRSLPENYR